MNSQESDQLNFREEQDPFIQALKVENRAGCPFRQYLERYDAIEILRN